MILSKRHKFLFIKGRKVAGTSVEVLLSEICGPEDIITPITPIDEKVRILSGIRCAQNYGLSKEENDAYLYIIENSPDQWLDSVEMPQGEYYHHISLVEILSNYGEIPLDWLIFAVERCPYRKILSFVNMKLKFLEYMKGEKVMMSDLDSLKKQLSIAIDDRSILNVRNIDNYKDGEGSVRTRIIYYENLEQDLERLMLELNIRSIPKLKHFKKGLSSISLNLKDFFSKQQLRVVNEIFQEEFQYFGYKMIN